MTIRAILINSTAQVVVEVQIEPRLEAYYKALNVGLIEAVHPRGIAGQDVMYVDEEGLLKPNQFFHFRGYPQPLAGNALILGTDADGNDIDAKTTLIDVQRRVTFYPSGTMPISGRNPWRADIRPRNVSVEDLLPRQDALDLDKEGQGQSG
jgi:hypothetical protein